MRRKINERSGGNHIIINQNKLKLPNINYCSGLEINMESHYFPKCKTYMGAPYLQSFGRHYPGVRLVKNHEAKITHLVTLDCYAFAFVA